MWGQGRFIRGMETRKLETDTTGAYNDNRVFIYTELAAVKGESISAARADPIGAGARRPSRGFAPAGLAAVARDVIPAAACLLG